MPLYNHPIKSQFIPKTASIHFITITITPFIKAGQSGI